MIYVSYIEIIGLKYPDISVMVSGQSTLYADLIHLSGDPIPDQATLDALIIAEIKDRLWKLIQVERDRRKAGGVLVNGYWFHSDDTSRIQQLGLVMMGQSLPAGIMWKTMAGTFVEMTPVLAGQIFQGIASKDISIFTVAEQRRAAMNASPTPETYDYLTGSPTWPVVYGE